MLGELHKHAIFIGTGFTAMKILMMSLNNRIVRCRFTNQLCASQQALRNKAWLENETVELFKVKGSQSAIKEPLNMPGFLVKTRAHFD